MSNLQTKLLLDFSNVLSSGEIVSVTVDFQGNPLILTDKENNDLHYYTIHHFLQDEHTTVYIPETTRIYKQVQPLGENWLLVETRIKDVLEKNAHVYTMAGKELYSFHIGDGVEDIQTTSDGHIWVSYFDEGVFGNTIGSNGVNCFNQDGHTRFCFHNQYHDLVVEGELPAIDDCYGMNVTSNDDVFLYYYGHFPLVHIQNRTSLKIWENVEMEGSHAFAVKNDYILFDSEYNSSNKVYLFHLQTKDLKEYSLMYNSELLEFDYAFARNSNMYFRKGTQLYVYELVNYKVTI